MKCDNCTNEAVYLLSNPAVTDTRYCRSCIPDYLKAQANRGDFDIKAAPVEAPKTSKKKAEEPAAE